MTVETLKRYLDNYAGDAFVGFLVFNLGDDEAYNISGYDLINPSDTDTPVIVLEMCGKMPLDCLRKEAADDDAD